MNRPHGEGLAGRVRRGRPLPPPPSGGRPPAGQLHGAGARPGAPGPWGAGHPASRAPRGPFREGADPGAGGPAPWEEESPDRMYAVEDERGAPSAGQPPPDPVTLVVAASEPEPGTPPEYACVLGICARPLAVAEVSAHLAMPVGAVAVLLADMLAEGLLEARAPVPAASPPDVALLEAVMHGLQRL
ncbi:hypothetical protein GCM10027168_16620 [Streptomyces capparidis]